MLCEIIYEDQEILVIHKPAGIATQSANIGQRDVVSELKGYLKKQKLLKKKRKILQKTVKRKNLLNKLPKIQIVKKNLPVKIFQIFLALYLKTIRIRKNPNLKKVRTSILMLL